MNQQRGIIRRGWSLEGDGVGGLSCLPCPYLGDPLLGLG